MISQQSVLCSFFFALVSCVGAVYSQRIDCDPCITRSEYTIKAIVHGTVTDGFWLNMQSSILQSGKDMGVNLEMELYEHYDPLIMAADIEAAATDTNPPDAILLTIPSDDVHDAIRLAVDAGIPVFGFNSGYQVAGELGLFGFVAQQEYMAGVTAAEEFIRIKGKAKLIKNAIFVNHQKGNTALEQRFQGFNATLHDQSKILAEELVVDLDDPEALGRQINYLFKEKCTRYDTILLGGSATAVSAVTALVENGCEEHVTIGTFDEGSFVMTSIIQGYIAFATSQQKYIQGVLPVVMSALYATTGKKLALPLDSKIYLTGPAVINQDNVPSDTLVKCENDAFPICPNIFAPDGTESRCGCFERNDIRIGGVLHGHTTDSFWDPVFASARQAASDMGIELELERFQPEDDASVLHNKMASRISTLCESGVDGIFVTIPSDAVVDAIKICQLLNVPVMSVNSGGDIAEQMGFQHIGQLEYNAGYGGGVRLIQSGMRIGYCLNHAPDVATTIERCQGFEAAIADAQDEGITYGGMVAVPNDNIAQYIINVEDAIGDDGDWDGIAVFLMGRSQIQAGALEIKKAHSEVMVGSFDVADYMYPLMEDGSILFGIDQQPYLQGNLPVYLLTYMAYTEQKLLNNVVQTGPDFVSTSPTIAKQICESNFYEVCSIIPEENLNYISTTALSVGYLLVALTLWTGLCSLFWVQRFRDKSIIKAGQPEFLVVIALGCMISILSIVPMGIETGYRYIKDPSTGQITARKNPDIVGTDAACMAIPWLYGIGFVLTFSALLTKIWRVKLIYKAGQSMRRKKVSIREVLPILIFMFTIEFAILLSWQFADPHTWQRHMTLESPDGYTLESVGECTSEKGWFFMLGLVLFHIVCLCYALVLCFQTKDIPTDFSESNWVSLSVLCIFQVSVLAIPIAAMVRDETDVFYFVRACAIFLQNFTVLCLIFGPKISRVVSGNDEINMEGIAGRASVKRASNRMSFLRGSTDEGGTNSKRPSANALCFDRSSQDTDATAGMGGYSRSKRTSFRNHVSLTNDSQINSAVEDAPRPFLCEHCGKECKSPNSKDAEEDATGSVGEKKIGGSQI